MEASQNAYDVTAPLLRQVPQTALDAVFGAAALVTAELKLTVVGRSWDEFMARSGRNDLTRNALLGSTILLFFRNDEQRRVFESLLHSMHSDELGMHNQVVDLGTKDKPFYVQLHVQGLWQEGVFAGYFVHCLDISREHTNRLALIERDREFQSQRESVDKSNSAMTDLQDKLRAASEEIAQREAQLRKMTEKSVRLEKSSKEALERAEKSVEKSSRLQHELDKLRKQQTDNAKAVQDLEQMQAEFAKLSAEYQAKSNQVSTLEQQLADGQTELEKSKQECLTVLAAATSLEQELASAREQHGGQELEASATAQEIAKLEATIRELNEVNTTAQQEMQSLEEALTQSQQEVAQLKAVLTDARSTPPQVVKETVVDETATAFLNLISQPACYLDVKGNIVCATGSFWEEVGAVAVKGVGRSFAELLSEEECDLFTNWLHAGEETTCKVTTADGTPWLACAVIGTDGNWQAVTLEAQAKIVPVAASPGELQFEFAAPTHSQMRVLSRELADEFSNLLTGVLGHASLAAAEQDGATSRDIQAIERTAREAAQLVRKLSALSGSGRHVQENDLAPLLKQFVKKLQPGLFGERPQLVLCDDACRVHGDTNGIKMVLEAITAHARENLGTQGQVCYTLSHSEAQACLSLSYDGTAGFPGGWQDGPPPAVGQTGWDMIFAREVLRGMGGEMELSEDGNRSMLLITLPLVVQAAEA
jgi:chemotaxis protein histidine kinase CheA